MLNNKVRSETLFLKESIDASGTTTSQEIDLRLVEGFFALFVEASGDGAVKFEAHVSLGNSSFILPVEQVAIAVGHTSGSGSSSDGKDVYSFNIALADSMKIVATETGGANAIVLDKVILGWQ